MKFLKIILYTLLGIMFIYLISNLFFSEKFKVFTSIEIDSSPYIVYDQINNFENWENWDPWIETDTTIKMSISDILMVLVLTEFGIVKILVMAKWRL